MSIYIKRLKVLGYPAFPEQDKSRVRAHGIRY
jgi:hypothetical protein